MEAQDVTKIGIGSKEHTKLKPGKVKIMGVHIQNKKKDDTPMKTPLANILCKHPEREEVLKVSKVKLERNGKLDVVALWVSLDEDGLIIKSSAIAELLRFLQVKTIAELTGKEVELVEQSKDDNYLCIKAY